MFLNERGAASYTVRKAGELTRTEKENYILPFEKLESTLKT